MPLFNFIDDNCYFCKMNVAKNDRQDMVIIEVEGDDSKGAPCKRVCEGCIPLLHKALKQKAA